MRTFIAIELDKDIRSAMDNIIEKIRTQQSTVKWIRHQSMHLTLKFLGEIDTNTADSAALELERTGKNHTPFSLHFRGTGTFPPNSTSPKVIWAGIDPNPNLTSLHEDIENRFQDLGFSKEKRPFRPHLTLGRVKSSTHIKPVLNKLSEFRNLDFGKLPVSRIFLFQSILKSSGAEYIKLKEVSLSC